MLNLTPSDQSNCKSIELQAKLASSQFNAKSAMEDSFDQPDGLNFAKNLVLSS